MPAEYLPDPVERGVARCEAWADENVDGDEATCGCGRTFKLEDGETISPDPYAIPICPLCFEEWWKEHASSELQ